MQQGSLSFIEYVPFFICAACMVKAFRMPITITTVGKPWWMKPLVWGFAQNGWELAGWVFWLVGAVGVILL